MRRRTRTRRSGPAQALFLLLLVWPFERAHAEGPIGKVIAVYPDRNTTKLVLETRESIIPGRQVYVGPERLAITVGGLLSRSELSYYYSASAPDRPKIESGDEANTEGAQTLSTPNPLTLTIREHYTFEQKRRGEVTAVQGDHAMIDRGSLHEVRERDIYRIYDSSGHYKGLIELRGIGDLQSSGKLYNALEDLHRDALKAAPGDRVVFAGQRKLFGLGVEGGVKSHRSDLGGTHEQNFGAGLLWNVTFPDGWGIELLFGTYVLNGKDTVGSPFNPLFPTNRTVDSLDRKAFFSAPIWLKKNFFYPSIVSPFLAAGGSLLVGENHWVHADYSNPANNVDVDKKTSALVPVLGAGLEFFPGRFLRPRIDVRYFAGPRLTAGADVFHTESVFYSVGVLTTW